MHNNNSKIILTLSSKSIKANKNRNFFAIVAIALTSLLFTILFTLLISSIKTIEQQTMRQVGTSAHAGFKYLTVDEFNKIKNHNLIREDGYNVFIGNSKNEKLIKRQVEIRYASDNEAKMGFTYPTTGKMPQAENEIAVDTIILGMLDIPHELGQVIPLEYSINDKIFKTDFILCGFWEGDVVNGASQVYLSKAFTEKALVNEKYDRNENELGAGFISYNVKFKNSSGIEENVKKVLSDCGFAEGEIEYGINWAYMSSNLNLSDPTTIVIILSSLILITFTGYLIIYNIFQISIIKDIKFYGLLKTIGTTSKQIKKMVRNQAILLSVIGIPIGLVIGYILGVQLLPILFGIMSNHDTYISTSPIIFIGSCIFALITVFISCKKPSKIASSISPIEAVKYTGIQVKNNKLNKKSINGSKIYKMAFSNLSRNKKRTIIVIVSMSLSLILLNTIYTLVSGFDIDKYLNIVADFQIAHASYFNYSYANENQSSPNIIKYIEDSGTLEEGGKLYFQPLTHKLNENGLKNFNSIFSDEYFETSTISFIDALKHESEAIKSGLDDVIIQTYGLDDFPASKLSVIDGELDLEKFKTGNYIILSPPTINNDNDNSESYYNVGDKIEIDFNDITKEYEVMAIANIPYSISIRFNTPCCIGAFLPSDEFIKNVSQASPYSYVCNIKDEYIEDIENFLKNYTENIESDMVYKSKKVYEDEFNQMVSTFSIIGGTLVIVIGVIGILNFINSILTGIISRLQEFAVLQSIGMTQRQVYTMIIYESLYYVFLTIVASVIIGMFFSLTVIKLFSNVLSFFNYSFTIMPILAVTPILIIFAILISSVCYKNTSKQSIVERLRLVE